MRLSTRLVLALGASLAPFAALGQSVPGPTINPACNAVTGVNCTIWTPAQWISAWQAKVDVTGGASTNQALTTPSIAGGVFSGTLSGSPAVSGSWTFSAPAQFGLVKSLTAPTWSGSSAPQSAVSGIFATEVVAGVSNDGGQPPLNYFRVTSNYVGIADTGFWFENDAGATLGGHVGLLVAAANDAYTGYNRPAWTTLTTYAAGQVVTVAPNVIYATSTGTSGGVTPACSRTTPTCSDGTVAWAWSGVTADDPNLVGAVIKANPTVSWGGTSNNPIGDTYGLNVLATCGAAGLHFCIGNETDVGITTGNTVQQLVGQQIVISGGASGTASVESVGLRFGSQGNGATPFQNLLALGGPTSSTIVSTTGYGIQAFSQNGNTTTPNFMAGAGAVDMQMWQPSSSGPFGGGFAWRSQGAQILGAGDVQSNFVLLHATGTGATLDVSEYQVATVAVNSGGTGWSCTGKWAKGTNGSIVSISTISGGAVTGISLVLGGFSSSALTTETFSADQPYNCGTVTPSGAVLPPSTFTATETSVRANSGAPILTLGGVAPVNIANTLGLTAATWADNHTCTAGQISVDAGFIYVCTATNTVKRVALSSF